MGALGISPIKSILYNEGELSLQLERQMCILKYITKIKYLSSHYGQHFSQHITYQPNMQLMYNF